jgi:cytochrome c556
MLGFLKGGQWSRARVPQQREKWEVDRNWHRSEAQRHLKAGNHAEAEPHLAAAVEDADQRSFPPAQRIALRLELAQAQHRLGAPNAPGEAPRDVEKLRAAEGTLRMAAVIAAQASASDQYLSCLDALADVLADMEDFKGLEEALKQAIRLGAASAHEDPRHQDDRIRRMAHAQLSSGRVEEALATLNKAIAFREKTHGANHEQTADLLAEVGKMCLERGDHPRAQDYLRRAMHAHEAGCGEDSAQAYQDVQQLARSFEETGDVESAAAQYERSLGLKLRKLGCGNIDEVAEMQFHLANLYLGWGNTSRARELLSDCIGAFQRTGGPRLAVAYETLAQVEEKMGRVSFALEELEKACNVWDKCGSERVRELSQNLEYRADLLDQLRQRVEANWMRKKAAELLDSVSGEPSAEARTA